MKTIVFAARKGGCSKTTLTAHLAVEAAKSQPVTLVDTDPQLGLTEWWELRQAETPNFMQMPVGTLGGVLAKAADEPGLVMIDTPPNDSATIGKVIELADLVVIPCRPSPNDLRGVAVTVDMVRSAGKPFLFVVTQAIQRTLITDEVRAALAAHGPVSQTTMFMRVDYAGAMTDGRTASELDSQSRAAGEITALWKSVYKQLNKSVKTRK